MMNATLGTICGKSLCDAATEECCYNSNPWFGYHHAYCCNTNHKLQILQTTAFIIIGWITLIVIAFICKCISCKKSRNPDEEEEYGEGGASAEHKLPTYDEIIADDEQLRYPCKPLSLPGIPPPPLPEDLAAVPVDASPSASESSSV